MQYKIIVDKQPRTNPSSDKRQYVIDIEELRYLGDIYDSLIITKEEDYVIRRLSLSEYGVLSVLDKEVIEPIDNINIELFEGDNYIYLADMTGNYIYAEYLLKNEFTDMYITEAEMNTAIKQTEKTIELSVNQKLTSYSTIEELTNAKNEAIDTANGNTDEKLKNYTTTIDMKAEINASADGVKTEVSKTYSTIENTNKAKQDAIDSANNSTDEKLKDYSTTLEMNAAIDVKADGITSSVSKIYATKDEVYSSVGTVNLLINSDFSHQNNQGRYDLKNWLLLDYTENINKIELIDDKTWFHFINNTQYEFVALEQDYKPVDIDTDYVFSMKYKNNAVSSGYNRFKQIDVSFSYYTVDGISAYTEEGGYVGTAFNVGDTMEEQEFSFSFKTPKQIIYIDSSGNEIYTDKIGYMAVKISIEAPSVNTEFNGFITNLQLEKNTVPTEWRPSQTDFYYQVEQYSKVTQTVEEVKIEVGKKVDEEEFTGANFILGINDDISGATIEADKVSFKRKRN